MTVALRRAAPDDYDVVLAGEIVGRICRMKADRQLWRWMIRLWAQPPVICRPKAAFRAMRRDDRCRSKPKREAGPP